MTAKILIVEDNMEIREEVVECLTDDGFECVAAANGEEGLDMIRRHAEVIVVLSDILMPGKTGLEMIRAAQSEFAKDRDLEFVILTGHGGSREAIDSLKLGVMEFLEKPIDLDHLLHVVRRAEELVLLKRANRYYQAGLEADVQAKTLEVRKLLGGFENAYKEALECLSVAAEYKDPETGNHIRRIGEYAQLIAKELGWSEERQNLMLLAAPLHDLGKIGTPDSVLLKPGKLNSDEVAIMKQHAQNGYDILASSRHPIMQAAASIARNHHERWDGSGYPRGLSGTEIPIEARITALVDVYDALRSKRPYKPAFDQEKTLSIMLQGDGRTEPSHFDPEMIDILRKMSGKFDEIYLNLVD
ncbi:MAG: putative two-component system response regulator [Candidatus Azotimanducaceae bacterium]|jgi:putative two-component system response regulator